MFSTIGMTRTGTVDTLCSRPERDSFGVLPRGYVSFIQGRATAGDRQDKNRQYHPFHAHDLGTK